MNHLIKRTISIIRYYLIIYITMVCTTLLLDSFYAFILKKDIEGFGWGIYFSLFYAILLLIVLALYSFIQRTLFLAKFLVPISSGAYIVLVFFIQNMYFIKTPLLWWMVRNANELVLYTIIFVIYAGLVVVGIKIYKKLKDSQKILNSENN